MRSFAFSPDDKRLAGGVEDQSAPGVKRHEVRLLDTQTGTIRKTIPHPGTARAVAFSPDGNVLAIGGAHIPAQEARPLEGTIPPCHVGESELLSELNQKLERNN